MTTTIEALKLACPDMREIEFENIRKGDLIARYHSDGDVLVRTAFRQEDGRYWVDEYGCIVAERSESVSHYLLHRPERELPAEVGEMVRVAENIYIRINGAIWRNMRSGFTVEDQYVRSTSWERVYLTTQEPDDA